GLTSLIVCGRLVSPIKVPINFWVRITKCFDASPDFFDRKFKPSWHKFFFSYFILVTAHLKNPVVQCVCED
ncbi:MAG: hypothetical protein VXW88_02345, partial [Pseudomonadota bacterium]|nr:hypothetical protein [Pseudomonadota bacterium]